MAAGSDPARAEDAIVARSLRKAFGATVAVDGVDLTVAPGSVVAVLGPNGSGKTTLVRMLATLLAPDAGTARVCGFDVAADGRRVRDLIGLTGQRASVDDLLTGTENLRLAAGLQHLRRRDARRRVSELVERFGMATFADRLVAGYSGGMRRRLDLAVSIVGEPRLLFLDEPTTGLDPTGRGETWSIVRELVSGGTTILLTTQYLDEADQVADRVVVLRNGTIVADDAPAVLKARTGTQRLIVQLRSAEAAGAARRVLGDALVPDPRPDETDRTQLSVAVNEAEDVRRTLNELHGHVDVERIEVASPSLDDVFFALTAGPVP